MKWLYKEVRRISAENLRALCIKEDWYTGGDNDDYKHLLYDLADRKENLTTDDICEIAHDIIKHSDLPVEEFQTVAYKVMRITISYLVKVQEDEV